MYFEDINFNFYNKNVLIVGGSKGIGCALVKFFLNSGANVIYASRSKIKEKLKKKAIFLKTDITKENEIKRLFTEINKFKSLDILVNSAAVNYSKKNEKINIKEWNHVINTNLTSIFSICKLAIKKMKKNKHGKIVNISSIAGRHRSYVSGVHYVSSKAGLIGLTKQLAFECAKYNININAVCPSQTKTEMLKKTMSKKQILNLEKKIPMGRVAEIKEQIGPIAFLCSGASSYITGTYIDVNAGQI